MLQHDAQLRQIARSIERTIKNELQRMMKNDREKYEKFFQSFGLQLKYGIYQDYGMHKDLLQDLLLFRMMQNYQDKQFQSVLDSNLDLESEEEKKELEEKQESSKDMLEEMKKALEGKVGNVKLSGRLKSHPVCLSSEGELSMEMAKTLNAMPGTEGQKLQAQTVLEINPEHPIYQRLMELQTSDTAKLDEYAKLLYDQALLIAGMPVEDPVAFSNRICDLM